jgi:serpin B
MSSQRIGPIVRVGTVALLIALGVQNAPAQEQALTAAYNASGQDMFKRLSGASGNIVISPYSIGTAMAMALSGARGQTETEMASVLKQTLPRAAMDAANARARATLNGYDKSATPPTCPTGMKLDGRLCKGPRAQNGQCVFPARFDGKQCVASATTVPSAKLAIANALMLPKPKSMVSAQYVALLKDHYAAEVFRNAQLADINGWVKRKTEGKIDKILDQLDPSAEAVLLNAVYFKAAWLAAFDKRDTRDESFNLTESNKVQVPTMHRTAYYPVLTAEGYRAIQVAYVVQSLSMVIVVPDKVDGVGDMAVSLDARAVAKLLADMQATQPKRVELALPRFKAEYKADLIPPFKAAGMGLAFSDAADFSGMTGRPISERGLKIDQIVHRAVVEVEEQGTEAAAATAIVMVPTAAMPPKEPEYFRVDRPFLFYLVDQKTGAILFQGRISDPRA